eukprot:gene2216-2731_t
MSSKDIDFDELSNKSNQIINRISSFSSPIGLSSFNIERSLREIGDSSKQLNDLTSTKSTSYSTSEDYPRAVKKYGIDSKLISKNLSNITTSSFIEVETEPTDIDGFLRVEFENMIIHTISEIQKKTTKEFQENYENSSISEWNRDKKLFEETLGQKYIRVNKPTGVELGMSLLRSSSPPLAQSSFGGSSVAGGFGTSSFRGGQSQYQQQQQQQQQQSMMMIGYEERTKLSNKMRRYADIINDFDYHQADKTQVSRFPLAHKLMEADLFESNKHPIVRDAWSLVLKITNEANNNGSTASKQQQKPTPNELYQRTLQFLENQFIETNKSRLPKISNISSELEEIITFVSSNVQKPPIDSPEEEYRNCSIWSIIYYLFRAGYYKTSQDLVLNSVGKYKDLLSNVIGSKIRGDICSNEVKNRISCEYKIIRHESKDFFKIAIFNLLSSSDANNVHTKQLCPSIQDFIWWKLNFVKENSYSIQALQNEINDVLVTTTFDPLLTFQILLITSQFENAIVQLHQSNPEDALHFAIVLNYYNLLKIVRQEQTITNSLEIFNPQNLSINLVSMIRQYIKRFSSETDTKEALRYYLLIENDAIKTLCISDLIITSSDGLGFAKYISTLTEFIDKNQWRRIIEHSALEYENKNNYQSAISFWLMIEEYPRVLEIFNSRMSILLTTLSPERESLFKFGIQMFNENQMFLKTSRTEKTSYLAMEQLLQLCQFFDLYYQEKFQEALSIIDKLDILPLTEEDIEQKVENYRYLSSHITKNFSSILQSTMDIIVRKYNILSIPSTMVPPSNHHLYAGRLDSIKELKTRAQSLSKFTGRIDFPNLGFKLLTANNLFL